MRRCLGCDTLFESVDWGCPACGFAPPTESGLPLFAPDGAAQEAFDPALFRSLAELEGRSFWFRGRNRLVAWAVRRHFPAVKNLLEVGCGTGFVLQGLRRALPQVELVAGDLHPAGLAIARARVPDATFLQIDARSMPYRAEFDVVGAFDVLEHIDDDKVALEEICRSLRPGGGLVLTVPQHPLLWSVADEQARHRRRYTRSDLVAKVEAAGFAIKQATSFVSSLLPAMAMARWRRRHGSEFELAGELSCPPAANPLLEAALSADFALIRRGWSLPAGGSLLVVASKMSPPQSEPAGLAATSARAS